METLLLTLIIVILAILGLAVGAMAGRGPIKGSCGGLACHKGIDCATCKSRSRKVPQ